MRILNVVADGSRGGGTTHVLELVRHQVEAHTVAVLSQPGSPLLAEASAVADRTFAVDFFCSPFSYRVRRALHAALAGFRPDLIHVHGARAALPLILAARHYPVVYSIHGFHHSHRSARTARALGRVSERAITGRASETILISSSDAELARHSGFISRRASARIIHHGLPDHAFRTVDPGRRPNRRIGFIGRLEAEKDPMLFLDVLALLPDHSGIIIGTGDLQPSVRQRADVLGLGARLTLHGARPHQETLDQMQGLSVLVVPSRWEAFGLVAAEALAQGLPVVAADVGGIPEVVSHGISGFLVGSRDPAAFARAVRSITDDPGLGRQMGIAGREHVASSFTRARMLAETDQAYLDAVRRHHPY